MNQTAKDAFKVLLVVSLAAVTAAGCEASDKRTEATATGPSSTAEAPTASPTAHQGTSKNREHYALESPSSAIRVGQKERTELSVTPTGALKINHEFPWAFEFNPPQGVQLAQTSFSKEQIELRDQRATISTFVEADEAGEHRIEATGNFSVCTDTKCYVIRDEPVSFVLRADDGPEAEHD